MQADGSPKLTFYPFCSFCQHQDSKSCGLPHRSGRSRLQECVHPKVGRSCVHTTTTELVSKVFFGAAPPPWKGRDEWEHCSGPTIKLVNDFDLHCRCLQGPDCYPSRRTRYAFYTGCPIWLTQAIFERWEIQLGIKHCYLHATSLEMAQSRLQAYPSRSSTGVALWQVQ